MKKHGEKALYGIILVGFLIALFHVLNDSGGSAFGNIYETLHYVSLSIFIVSSGLFIYSFKFFIKKITIWMFFIFSLPLTASYIGFYAKKFYYNMIDTTTPEKYLYNVDIDPKKYQKDKIRLENQVDSLLNLGVVMKTAELNTRYFEGQYYNDTIERDWAIDLPQSLKYNQTIIDTLFYDEKGDEIIAGLLISEVYNEFIDYPKGGIEFIGRGFKYKKNNTKPFLMLRFSVTGHKSYTSCSDRLRYYYFKRIGTYENDHNMNDIRFLYPRNFK